MIQHCIFYLFLYFLSSAFDFLLAHRFLFGLGLAFNTMIGRVFSFLGDVQHED